MNAASRLLGLSIALSFAVGCSSKVDTSIQLNQVEVTNSGKLAWSNADRPSLVDLDDSYNYQFDELPTQGEASQIPWAGDYWSTYKDSINQKVLGEELSQRLSSVKLSTGLKTWKMRSQSTTVSTHDLPQTSVLKTQIAKRRTVFKLFVLSVMASKKAIASRPGPASATPGLLLPSWKKSLKIL